MIYKLFVSLSLSGLNILFLRVSSKADLYTFIGYLVCNSLEHINRFDYKVVLEGSVFDNVIDFSRWASVHLSSEVS